MVDEQTTILELNSENFEDAVKNNSALAVDFWAPWCPSCLKMLPAFDYLAATHKGRVTFAKINIDESRDLVIKYAVYAIPTMLLFRDGKLIGRKIGEMSRMDLMNELERSLDRV